MDSEQITQLLRDLAEVDATFGTPVDGAKVDRLIDMVYDELRELARSQLGSLNPGQTVQATMLVHEAYLKLFGHSTPSFVDRRHFFGAAARAMRNFLIDTLRKRDSRGVRQSLTCCDAESQQPMSSEELMALNDALARLELHDKLQYDIVMLRYFAGLSIHEVASVLEVSASTVDRNWRFARALLHRDLRDR